LIRGRLRRSMWRGVLCRMLFEIEVGSEREERKCGLLLQ
jgi:hypothetical protein